MPRTNQEAADELEEMRQARDLTIAWIARRMGKNEIWVRRKLNGSVHMRIDDYALLRATIESVSISA